MAVSRLIKSGAARFVTTSITPRSPIATARSLAILCLVNFESPPLHFRAIQRLHGTRGIGVGHLDERETARTSSVTIRDQSNLLYRPMLGKQPTHGFFGSGKRKIADIKLGHCELLRNRNERAVGKLPRGSSSFARVR